jgi:hypothetical protein
MSLALDKNEVNKIIKADKYFNFFTLKMLGRIQSLLPKAGA